MSYTAVMSIVGSFAAAIAAGYVLDRRLRRPRYGNSNYHDYLLCHHPEELRAKFGDAYYNETRAYHAKICRCPPGQCPSVTRPEWDRA